MPTFLVTLATGQQGQATVDALLANGAQVHAVVRDPSKAAARELESKGVTLFQGDNNNMAVFQAAAKGCAGLFLNLVEWPHNPEPGRQAENILAACKAAGVEHVVASTAGAVGDRKKWESLVGEGKWLGGFFQHESWVEDAVRRSGFKTFAILRPYWFHSNYLPPVAHEFYPGLLDSGILVHSFEEGARFPHVNVKDIGRVGAMALLDPAKFDKQEVELGSENLSIEDVADALSKAMGRPVELRKREVEDASSPIVQWQSFASAVDLKLDTASLAQQYGLRFTTLEEYLVTQRERLTLD